MLVPDWENDTATLLQCTHLVISGRCRDRTLWSSGTARQHSARLDTEMWYCWLDTCQENKRFWKLQRKHLSHCLSSHSWKLSLLIIQPVLLLRHFKSHIPTWDISTQEFLLENGWNPDGVSALTSSLRLRWSAQIRLDLEEAEIEITVYEVWGQTMIHL